MYARIKTWMCVALVTSFLSVGTAFAQTETQVESIRRFFSGQRILVTFRSGAAIYGTYVFLDVHFCPSGKYMSFGQSRKQTVLNNEQVNNWRDSGVWNVDSFHGEVLLRYVSVSGERNALPVRRLPDGGVWLGEGISIQPRGYALCK
jgi:hypothetical protein